MIVYTIYRKFGSVSKEYKDDDDKKKGFWYLKCSLLKRPKPAEMAQTMTMIPLCIE